jgi:DNA-binding HxlR family transcriptional regulator
MYERKIAIDDQCGLDLLREVLNGKWKFHLLWYVGNGVQRPSELARKIPEAARRVLNMQLAQLEEHELVCKKVYHQLPLKVEYSLTEKGQSLLPLIGALGFWGDDNRDFLQRVIGKTNRFASSAVDV